MFYVSKIKNCKVSNVIAYCCLQIRVTVCELKQMERVCVCVFDVYVMSVCIQQCGINVHPQSYSPRDYG